MCKRRSTSNINKIYVYENVKKKIHAEGKNKNNYVIDSKQAQCNDIRKNSFEKQEKE